MENDNDEMPIAYEFNGESGETTIRPLSESEIEQREADAQEIATQQSEKLAAQQAREASIRKMAEASGLSEAEIEALF